MKIAALLLAAGSGSRFISSIPKQFCMLHGKKVYRHPLDILIRSKLFSTICVVVNNSHSKYLDRSAEHTVTTGGKTRQESVLLGLQSLDADYVVICDGVRPFLTIQLLKEHINRLMLGADAVNTCISCADTINIRNEDTICAIPSRDTFLRGQTPQSFPFKKLLTAHQNTNKQFTDDCGLMLNKGFKVVYTEGSVNNIKVTTAIDLDFASLILDRKLTFS